MYTEAWADESLFGRIKRLVITPKTPADDCAIKSRLPVDADADVDPPSYSLETLKSLEEVDADRDKKLPLLEE